MSDYVLRTATEADRDALGRVRREAFGLTHTPVPNDTYHDISELDRSHLVEHRGQVVGVVAAFTRDMAVPGTVVPVAHVTGVVVSPVHTRKGLLRRMITEQLRSAPEAVAALWASEGRIYQRFGYGLAAQNLTIRADRRELSLRVPPAPGTLRSAVPSDVIEELSQVYSQVLPTRPGWSSRDATWWGHLTSDLEHRREGTTPARAVLWENPDGVVEGYARYRIKPNWDDNGPKQEVNVIEVVATTTAAYAELYRFLLRVDLSRTLVQGCSSVEEPLFYMVDEPRQLGGKVGDGLWVRITDLPRALTARKYAAPVDVVLGVTDALMEGNAGRWRLRVGAGGAVVSCTPADGEPDLSLDIADVAAVYLGGTSLGALHLAGRVREHRPSAVAAASAAFGWPTKPNSIEIF
ncbi:GNAT family N-acetyltransferase [Dactylosporangium sp. NPDC051485]|uniref:GNAT family N-acetyltransferase n=1 Tax=Dactylosporangium sp. NPDC051485 TaxID=3154846 RepID=UPI00344A5424